MRRDKTEALKSSKPRKSKGLVFRPRLLNSKNILQVKGVTSLHPPRSKNQSELVLHDYRGDPLRVMDTKKKKGTERAVLHNPKNYVFSHLPTPIDLNGHENEVHRYGHQWGTAPSILHRKTTECGP